LFTVSNEQKLGRDDDVSSTSSFSSFQLGVEKTTTTERRRKTRVQRRRKEEARVFRDFDDEY
jgi:hypothetical protein